ncbi:MAG: hypothetical protein MRK00_16325 [Nitrosomonas sp.]|nr:hypothetical protein [Nitrosomonas sp.]
MMGEEKTGSRKVVMTKWMLIIYAIGTAVYLLLMGFQGATPPDSFMFNFTLGVGAIGGAFSLGNMMEHRYKAIAVNKEENKPG